VRMPVRLALFAILVTTLGCASPAPTAPSRLAAAASDLGFSTPVAASHQDGAFCDRFSGESRGLCHAVIALNCGPGDHRQACTELFARFAEATGRTYVGRSPEECAVIRFFCQEGTTAFFDPTGCGCEPAAP